jgi:hypothetical protein
VPSHCKWSLPFNNWEYLAIQHLGGPVAVTSKKLYHYSFWRYQCRYNYKEFWSMTEVCYATFLHYLYQEMRSSEWNLYKNTVTNTCLLKITHSLILNKVSLSPQVEMPLK